jgi:tellurite methyltransferase
MTSRPSVEFFETQFRRQVAQSEFALNPFELLALEHVRGEVLDLGCGLGNLALEAARRGHRVRAIDGSATAVEHIREAASRQGLAVTAEQADFEVFDVEGRYDSVVSIGLLMFFARERALELLAQIQRAVAPGGVAIVNVLVEGTTFVTMFDPRAHYLFRLGELEQRFSGWEIRVARRDSFPAPGDTTKEFVTLVAAAPSAS